MNKKKIINDPVYGFIALPSEIIFDIIEHPWFQRLRRIQQLGLSGLVYPGAQHSRFQHAIGAVHLMNASLEVLRSKGISITDAEAEAVMIAILMHDIGHGPFSHTLEQTIVNGIHHEELSLLFMERMNQKMNGKLSLAIKIFTDKYHKKFLHQLVSGQLDMDRLDYLNRDSFFSGVAEGVIGYDRIIKMLTVHKGELVVEAKGIYSIEKFIVSRRLMYWQVYLHKTVLSAEQMLVQILRRARELCMSGNELFSSPALKYFLSGKILRKDFLSKENVLVQFASIDDVDVIGAIKVWQSHPDKILSFLSKCLVNRKLFRIELLETPFDSKKIEKIKNQVMNKFQVNETEVKHLMFAESTSNNAYDPKIDQIKILMKDGKVKDITRASDQLNISLLAEPVVKYYLCVPREIKLK